MGGAPEIGVRIKGSGSEEIRQQLALIRRDAQDTFVSVDRVAGSTSSSVTASLTRSVGAVATVNSSVGGLASTLRGFGDSIANAFSFVLQKVVETSGQISLGAGIAGAGLTGLVYSARSYTQTIAEAVSGTAGLADQLGLTVGEFTRLQAAFRTNGGDGDKLGEGLVSLQGKVLLLAKGNEQAIEAFGQLGLSMRDLRDGNGNLLGTRQQLDLVLDRLADVERPALRAKATLDLFGKSGAELGSLVHEGSLGLEEAEKNIERFGTVVDDATRESFDEGISAQGKLAESLKGLGLSLTRVFFPFFTESSKGLSDWLNNNREAIEKFLGRVRDVAENVKTDLKTVFSLVTGGMGGRRWGDRGSTDDEGDGYLTPLIRSRKVVVNGRTRDLDDLDATARKTAPGTATAARAKGDLGPLEATGAARPFSDPAPRTDATPGPAVVRDGRPDYDSLGLRRGYVAGQGPRAARAKGGPQYDSLGMRIGGDAAAAPVEQEATSEGEEIEAGGAMMVPEAATKVAASAERFAEVNGRRVRLAVRRANEEMRGLGGRVFNYPVFGQVARVVSGLSAAIGGLFRAIASRAFADFVGLVGAVGNAGAQAGRAMASLGGYIVTGVAGVTGAAPSLTGMFNGIARAFADLRRGLQRGFRTRWARDLRRAADDVFATLRGLTPFATAAWQMLQGLLVSAAAQLSAFTGMLRGLPGALTSIGPALTGVLGTVRLGLGSWLVWLVTWGAGLWATVNGSWMRVALGIGSYVPVIGAVLSGMRGMLDGFAQGTLGFGMRVAEGLAGPLSADRLNGMLAGGRQALDGFATDARSAGDRLTGAVQGIRPQVEAGLGSVVEGMQGAADRGRDALGGLARGAADAGAEAKRSLEQLRPEAELRVADVVEAMRGAVGRGGNALGVVAELTEHAADAIGQRLDALRPEVEGRLGAVSDGMQVAVERGRGTLDGWAEGAFAAGRKLLDVLNEARPEITDRVDAVTGGVRDAVERGRDALGGLPEAAREASRNLGQRLEALKPEAERGVAAVTGAMRDASDRGREALGGLAQGAGEAGRAVAGAVDQARPQVRERAAGVVEDLRGTVQRGSGLLDFLLQKAKDFAEGFMRALGSLNTRQIAAIASTALYFLSGTFNSATLGFGSFVGAILTGLLFIQERVGATKAEIARGGPVITPSSFVAGDLAGSVRGQLGVVVGGIQAATQQGRGLLDGFLRGVAAAARGLMETLSRLSPGGTLLRFIGLAIALYGFAFRSLEFKIIGVAVAAFAGSMTAVEQLTKATGDRLKANGGLAQPASLAVDGAKEQLVGRLGGILDASKERFRGYAGGVGGILGTIGAGLRGLLSETSIVLPLIAGGIGLALRSPALQVGSVVVLLSALLDKYMKTLSGGREQAAAAERSRGPDGAAMATPASLVQKAALPLAAVALPAAFPLLTWFTRGMTLLGRELAPAARIFNGFGAAVTGIFTRIGAAIGNALGVNGAGAKGVLAGVAGIVIAVLYATGALGAMQAMALLATTTFAGLFYIIGIGTFTFTLLSQTVIFAVRAMGLAVFLMSALAAVANGVFAAIRAGFIAFRTFMLVTAALTPLQFALAMGGIVVLAAAAFGAILYFFPETRKAFAGLCRAMVSAFGVAVDALRATWGFFIDVFSDEDGATIGFFRAIGMMGRKFWDDFLNIGIAVWNKLKSFFGLPETAYINRAQEAYDEEVKKRLGQSKEDYQGIRQRQVDRIARLRAEGKLAPEDPNNPDLPAPAEMARRRAARAALARAEASGKTGEEAAAAANAELAAKKAEEDKKAAEEKEGGFDGFLRQTGKSLSDRWGATAKDAKGQDRGFLDRSMELLGLGGGGKDGKGGLLDSLFGAFKAPSKEEMDKYAAQLRAQGLGEADVKKKVKEKFGDGKGFLGGLLDALKGNEAEAKVEVPEVPDFNAKIKGLLQPAVAEEEEDPSERPGIWGELHRASKGLSGASAGGREDDLVIGASGLSGYLPGGRDPEPPRKRERRAGLDVRGMLGGLDQGLSGQSDFAGGVPEPIILDAQQREAARRRRERGGEGEDARKDVRRVGLVIQPGDDGLYGRQEGIDRIVKQLTDVGMRVKTDIARDA